MKNKKYIRGREISYNYIKDIFIMNKIIYLK
jgi:hypothetical protein